MKRILATQKRIPLVITPEKFKEMVDEELKKFQMEYVDDYKDMWTPKMQKLFKEKREEMEAHIRENYVVSC